jgi:hypothetical protein
MTTAKFWNNSAGNGNQDPNGYYTVKATQFIDPNNPQSTTQSLIKLKFEPKPAEGSNEVQIKVTLTPEMVVPVDGFTMLMKVVYTTRSGNLLQALLSAEDTNVFVAAGANYVESTLVSIPFTEKDYVDLHPGSKYYVTVDLHQEPMIQLPDDTDTVDVVDINDDPSDIPIPPVSETVVNESDSAVVE